MLVLRDYQEDAVKKLLDYTYDALQENGRKIQMLLEAPTGSGKTVTMAAYLARLVQEIMLRPNLSPDIAFIWLAPNTLHLQSYKTLKWFYSELHDITTLQVDELENNCELQPKDLLFLNWASVDKEKNIFRKENEKNYNIQTLIDNTYLQGTEIIVIIDEAHLSAFTGEQAKKVLRMINAKIEISVTATPPSRPAKNVIIERHKVVKEEMIKKGVKLNIDLSPSEQLGELITNHLLQKALNKRDEIAHAYSQLGVDINPLLLIQLPSEKVTLTDEDKKLRDIIEAYLKGNYGISTDNHLLSVWLSDSKDKIELEGIEQNNALQKVLIFKQAISQGWDCPRAAVLIILREYGNFTFGIQTVGRILRMPEQKHYNNDILDFGYVYTNIESNKLLFKENNEDVSDYFSTKIATLKTGLTNCQLKSSFMVNDRPNPGNLASDFEKIFYKIIEDKYKIKQIPEEHLFLEQEPAVLDSQIILNRTTLTNNSWNLKVDEIEINIPTDISIDNYDANTIINIESSHIGHFAKTQAELSELLDRFCFDSITVLNKSKSWKVLRKTLIQFVEYYLSLGEFKARKILLYPQNKTILAELIQTALEHYDLWLKERGNKNRRAEIEEWQLPEERSYSELFKEREEIKYHALDPFYEYNSVSSVEKAFADLLESNKNYIEWWYKNGDKGREHFAVTYTNSTGELSLFYVDFVIHFKNGKIGLFDTKTKRSDSEASNKHNALIDFIEAENNKNGNTVFIGGITIPELIGDVDSFRFPSCHISDTKDLTGWDFFNPVTF